MCQHGYLGSMYHDPKQSMCNKIKVTISSLECWKQLPLISSCTVCDLKMVILKQPVNRQTLFIESSQLCRGLGGLLPTSYFKKVVIFSPKIILEAGEGER